MKNPLYVNPGWNLEFLPTWSVPNKNGKPVHPSFGAADQATASATVMEVSRFGPPSGPTCRARCSWMLGRHSHAGTSPLFHSPQFPLVECNPFM